MIGEWGKENCRPGEAGSDPPRPPTKPYQQTEVGGWEIKQEAVKLSGVLLNLQGTWLGTSGTYQEVTGKRPTEGRVL